MTLQLLTDRPLVRAAAESVRYVLVRVVAPPAPARGERLPLDLALVVDRSGSMAGGKLALAQVAARRVVEALGPADRVALVQYDNEVDLLAPAAPLEPEHRRRLLEAIDRLDAGGSTWLEGGWRRGAEALAGTAAGDRLARCLLLSDGLANVGERDPEVLAGFAGTMRSRGVATSTFGIGRDFDERLMERMALAGGGNFYFIEQPAQIPDFLLRELGDALEVVARDAVLECTVPAGLRVELLDERRTAREGERLRIALDDLVANQHLELALRVTFPRSTEGSTWTLGVATRDAAGVLDRSVRTIAWTSADHEANDAAVRERQVDRAVARRYAARAQREAAEANREGNLERARQILRRTASRIRDYAGGDRELHRIAEGLEQEHEVHFAPMSALMLKGRVFASHNALREYDELGAKRRGPRREP